MARESQVNPCYKYNLTLMICLLNMTFQHERCFDYPFCFCYFQDILGCLIMFTASLGSLALSVNNGGNGTLVGLCLLYVIMVKDLKRFFILFLVILYWPMNIHYLLSLDFLLQQPASNLAQISKRERNK